MGLGGGLATQVKYQGQGGRLDAAGGLLVGPQSLPYTWGVCPALINVLLKNQKS